MLASLAFPVILLALQSAPAAPATSLDYAPPETVADVDYAPLREASGLIASRRNPGIWYTQNDSGGEPAVYALNECGVVVAVILVGGAKNVDWEELAAAPASAGGPGDLVVADIGDNKEKREYAVLYRFAEPQLTQPAPSTSAPPTSASVGIASASRKSASNAANRAVTPETVRVSATAYRFVYEGGPCNAEALVVHPRSGDAFVIAKRENGRGDVYRIAAPWDNAALNRAVKIGELRFPDVPAVQRIATAADISSDGRRLAVRSYVCGWEWRLKNLDNAKALNAALDVLPRRIDLAVEQQGEAIAYSLDGLCLWTISEGTPTKLNRVCRE